MARRTPHHAERPQDRRVPLTPQFGEPPPSESPGSRVPPQRDFWKRSGQHEPRKVPGLPGRSPSKALHPTRAQPSPSESPGSRVPPQRDFWERSGQHEPRKAPGSRGALHRRHLLQPTHSHRLLKAFLTSHGTTTRSPKAPGVGCLRSAISGSEADSMSRGRHPAHGALSIEGTLPFIGAPPSPKPTGFRTNPMGTFPPCGKPVGPAKSPSAPLPHDHRPKAAVKGRATTRRQPWPIPSSNESGNTRSTRA